MTFLDHLIEFEMRNTKNYSLVLANASFRSKNTNNFKNVNFFEKHIVCKMYRIFYFVVFISFWEQFFQIQSKILSRFIYISTILVNIDFSVKFSVIVTVKIQKKLKLLETIQV